MATNKPVRAGGLVAEAREFAINAHHAAGVRYGAHPFVYHLDAVANTLLAFGHDDAWLLAAAYLHDVVEDTPVTLDEISDAFGSIVRDYVDAVTDVKFDVNGVLVGNRRARQELTYAKLRVIAIKHGECVANLKLADRIANVEETIKTRSSHLGMYHGEHDFFTGNIWLVGGDLRMWEYLNALVDSLPILIAQESQRKRDERQAAHLARLAESQRRKADRATPA